MAGRRCPRWNAVGRPVAGLYARVPDHRDSDGVRCSGITASARRPAILPASDAHLTRRGTALRLPRPDDDVDGRLLLDYDADEGSHLATVADPEAGDYRRQVH